MGRSKRWIGYGLAVVIALAGLVVYVVPLLEARRAVHEAVGSLQRVVVPGGGVFVADDAGPMMVFYEKLGTFEGERFETSPWMTPMRCEVRVEATGESVSVTTPSESVIYAVGERMGHAEWVADLPGPGRYTIDAVYEGDQSPQRRLLAIGRVPHGVMGGGWGGLYGGAAVLAFSLTAAAVIAIVTWASGRPGRGSGDLAI